MTVVTEFINWSAMTGSQIRAKVKELQTLSKKQQANPEKVAKPVEKKAAPAKEAASTVKKTAPVVKKNSAPAKGNRSETTRKRLEAMELIESKNMLALETTEAVALIMSLFGVPKNYAKGWLKMAAGD
jgi:hypothetical protein